MSTPPNSRARSRFSSQKKESAVFPEEFLLFFSSPDMLSSSCPAGGHSHLYNSLRPYLHNQSRAQPIIGLNSITEVLTHSQPAVYLCDVCFLRITKADIRNHIMGSIHKYNYTKSHHEHGWRSDTDLTLLARHLMEMAKMVEKKEGTGDIQVLCVDEVIYERITSAPLRDAFAQMKAIKNQQNLNAHVHNSLSEGNEANAECQQVSGNADGTAHHSAARCLLPTHHAFTIPSRSKRSVDNEPRKTSTTLRPNALLPRVKPLSSPPQSLADSHVSSRIPFPGSSISQHGNQDQPAIPHRKQSFQGYTVSSENQCLTQVWSLSTVRPPTPWSPVGAPCQNYMVYSGEENPNKVMQTFGVGYQTTPYETPSHPMNQMAPEITQDQWDGYFGNESSPAGPYPGCYMEMTSLIKPPGVLEPALIYPNQSNDQAYSQDPFNINWDTHVEAQSDNFSKENNFVFSPNPITQFPGPYQGSSEVDFVENYKGPKPLIGLQAVIKCLHVNGNPVPCFYLCQLCSLKLKKKRKIIKHLTNPEHQRNYLKVYHPELLPKKPKPGLTVKMLEKITRKLEKKDGRGQIKAKRFPAALFNKILNKDYKSCLHMVLYGSGVERRSDVFSFMEGNEKTAGPSSSLKRPAESIPPPSMKCLVEAPIQQVSKKTKTENPNTSANEVKETVFKVSLSLQAGLPIVIERKPLKDETTVAPEIETENPVTNTQSELHMCIHRCPHTVHCATQQYPGADEQIGYPTLTCLGSEEQVMRPAQFNHSEQLYGQTDEVCGSDDEEVTVECADWPEPGNWVFMNNEWQNGEERVDPEYAGYIQYW